ncbi:hypothetical protein BDZ91DRAFT_751478 [Kalaharituber pfeilii]|nr:hypothetical protein BDZ91DRAFT_751478 [Kalaharituber pfeilii]
MPKIGLRHWRYGLGKTDGPECRWCGEEVETTAHVLDRCRVWKTRWPGGRDALLRPPKGDEGNTNPLGALLDWMDGDGMFHFPL